MQLLGNNLTATEVARYLTRTEKRVTQLESELATLGAGKPRCRAFLHRELAEAYTIADELRNFDASAEDFGSLAVGRGVLGGLS